MYAAGMLKRPHGPRRVYSFKLDSGLVSASHEDKNAEVKIFHSVYRVPRSAPYPKVPAHMDNPQVHADSEVGLTSDDLGFTAPYNVPVKSGVESLKMSGSGMNSKFYLLKTNFKFEVNGKLKI